MKNLRIFSERDAEVFFEKAAGFFWREIREFSIFSLYVFGQTPARRFSGFRASVRRVAESPARSAAFVTANPAAANVRALCSGKSIDRISPAGSPIAASASVFHIPLSRRRQNHLCMLFRFPNSGGMSLHGTSVCVCHATALINKRLSFAAPPRFPACPGSSFFIRSRASSFISCR